MKCLDEQILEIINDSSNISNDQWTEKYGEQMCWEPIKTIISKAVQEALAKQKEESNKKFIVILESLEYYRDNVTPFGLKMGVSDEGFTNFVSMENMPKTVWELLDHFKSELLKDSTKEEAK